MFESDNETVIWLTNQLSKNLKYPLIPSLTQCEIAFIYFLAY